MRIACSTSRHRRTTPTPWGLVLMIAGAICLPAGAARAQTASGQEARFEEAVRPLASGVAPAAAARLEAFLATNPRPDLRAQARARLTEALVRSGRAPEALANLDRWGANRQPDLAFWRGQALAATGRWSAALQAYRIARRSGPAETRDAAAIGEAEALLAMGDTETARTHYEKLAEQRTAGPEILLRLVELALDSGDTAQAATYLGRADGGDRARTAERRYLGARLQLATGRAAEALAELEALADPASGVTRRVAAGVVVERSRALETLGRSEEARAAIESFIEQQPDNPDLGAAFQRLDDLLSREKAPSFTQLRDWGRRSPENRAAWAELMRGRAYAREGNLERAESSFARAARKPGEQGAAPYAFTDLAALQIRRGKPSAAIASATSAISLLQERDPERARARFVLAEAQFILQQLPAAAGTFERAAAEGQGAVAETARFNAAIAWLSQGSHERFVEDYKTFSALYPESGLRRELLFQEGRRQARAADSRAFQTLSVFVRDFPDHPRVPEALLAMAETALLSDPPNLEAASYYRKASTDASPAAPKDQADYLALFLADGGGTAPADVLALGRAFLANHPESTLAPDVRMKLGEICFRIEDYAAAQTEFESAAKARPEGVFAENALFLAGQAAVRSMNTASVERALELFEQVARRDGALKLAARREQARVKISSGREQEAVLLFDSILRSNPDDELKFAALTGKGEALFSLGGQDPKHYPDALKLFDELARDKSAPDRWRNEAAWRKGRTLEKMGDPRAALAGYYEVLERPPSGEVDFFWFYKSAFDAARLLEAAGDWTSAIAVYRQIAARKGPRAEEAAGRVTRLRMEHFLWEE
jgi:tetratricopeptide (TPR) repeat protein